MKNEKIDLEINKDLPVNIEITRGNIYFIYDENNAFVELNYTPFDKIKPELKLNISDKNDITFNNTEIIKADMYFHLPCSIQKISIHTNAGNIFIENAVLDIVAQSDSGDIKINNSKGFLNCTAFDGSAEIKDFDGNSNVQTNNGALRIINWNNAGGSLSSSYGPVLIGLKSLQNEVDVKSKGGKISLGLSENSPATIIARGTDVITYFTDSLKPDSMGSPSKIEWKGGGIKIQVFSPTDKVIIAKNENLKQVSPDFETLFKEFENIFRENIDLEKISSNIKIFGKKVETFGKKVVNDIKKNLNKNENENENENNSKYSSEKMEILKMLKEGKITAEEAESLLKVL